MNVLSMAFNRVCGAVWVAMVAAGMMNPVPAWAQTQAKSSGGANQLKSFQFFADKFSGSNPAGVKFEVIGIDNKLSPTESLNALKSAMDQGVRYITQGNGSSVALAFSSPSVTGLNRVRILSNRASDTDSISLDITLFSLY